MSARLASRPVGRTGLNVSELGFGAAPLGNLYAPLQDEDAHGTLTAALDAGVTYVDTAPFYGFGLSERRVGEVLAGRTDLVVSTKVGRLLVPTASPSTERHGFAGGLPFEPVFDYTYDGVMRSWESSLARLRLSRIDILYVHDIGRATHGEDHARTIRELTAGGGFRALEELRDGEQIRAFGIGVNETEVCLAALQASRLDVILLAGRYTLLEQTAMDDVFPACAAQGVSIVIGGPFNSGILAAGVRAEGPLRYNYAAASGEIVERVRRIQSVCDRHRVALAAAALQFPLAHRQVSSVIPGLADPDQVAQALRFHEASIPPDFWSELIAEGLLRPDAPTPVAVL